VQIADWRVRFEALEARKTAEALVAAIEPFTTEVDQPDAPLVAIGNPWSRRMFDGSFYVSPAPSEDLPAVSLVFVRSRDGDTVAHNPSTIGGGEADKHLIYEGLSRAAADAVLSGAATIRGGDLVFSVWHPELVALRASLGLPRHPMQIVATLQGMDLERRLMFNVPELRVTLITVARAAEVMRAGLAARPWITPIVMNDAHDLAGALRQLRHLGVGRLSCIGGRTIAAPLIDARLIQDLYLTTSAQSGGEANTPFYAAPLATTLIARKHGTGADRGVVFEHLSISGSQSALRD
jgi:riboflavin biosynthesis pyrimidine reductase